MPRKQRELRPNASPNDEAECFTEYCEHMETIQRTKQKLGVMLAKYERLGVHPDAIKHVYRMSFKEDAQEIHRQRTATLARLKIIEFGSDGQGSFVKGLIVDAATGAAAEKLALGRARAAGYNDGLAGAKVDSCPHPPGSEEYVTWRDGWMDGHNDLLEKNPDADKPKPPRAFGGRRKKSKPETTP